MVLFLVSQGVLDGEVIYHRHPGALYWRINKSTDDKLKKIIRPGPGQPP